MKRIFLVLGICLGCLGALAQEGQYQPDDQSGSQGQYQPETQYGSQGQQEPQAERQSTPYRFASDYYRFLVQESAGILNYLSGLQDDFTAGKQPLWAEVYLTPEKAYTPHLRHILLQQQVGNGGTEVPFINVNRWATALHAAAKAALKLSLDQAADGALRNANFELHDAYVKTLVTAFTYLESLKRAYLIPNAAVTLQGNNKQELLNRVAWVFYHANRLMKGMYALRTRQFTEGLIPFHVSGGVVWENVYGADFHYQGRFVPTKDQPFSIRPMDPYLSPFTDSKRGATAIDYVQVQTQLQQLRARMEADPKLREDQGIMTQLEALEKRMKELTPDSGTGESPSGQDLTKDNANLRRVTAQLQNYLNNPEVQGNARLKALIEVILKELTPSGRIIPEAPGAEDPKKDEAQPDDENADDRVA